MKPDCPQDNFKNMRKSANRKIKPEKISTQKLFFSKNKNIYQKTFPVTISVIVTGITRKNYSFLSLCASITHL